MACIRCGEFHKRVHSALPVPVKACGVYHACRWQPDYSAVSTRTARRYRFHTRIRENSHQREGTAALLYLQNRLWLDCEPALPCKSHESTSWSHWYLSLLARRITVLLI